MLKNHLICHLMEQLFIQSYFLRSQTKWTQIFLAIKNTEASLEKHIKIVYNKNKECPLLMGQKNKPFSAIVWHF